MLGGMLFNANFANISSEIIHENLLDKSSWMVFKFVSQLKYAVKDDCQGEFVNFVTVLMIPFL